MKSTSTAPPRPEAVKAFAAWERAQAAGMALPPFTVFVRRAIRGIRERMNTHSETNAEAIGRYLAGNNVGDDARANLGHFAKEWGHLDRCSMTTHHALAWARTQRRRGLSAALKAFLAWRDRQPKRELPGHRTLEP